MKFHEILAKEKDEVIVKRILQLYPDEKKNKAGYIRALKELRKIEPKRSEFSIRIISHKDGKDKYEHVDGYRHGQGYGIEFSNWSEWLGMWVDQQSYYRLENLDFVSHCVWEMTWSGYSNKGVQGEWKALTKKADRAMKQIAKRFKVPKQELGKVPNPRNATKKPKVDLSNKVKKGDL